MSRVAALSWVRKTCRLQDVESLQKQNCFSMKSVSETGVPFKRTGPRAMYITYRPRLTNTIKYTRLSENDCKEVILKGYGNVTIATNNSSYTVDRYIWSNLTESNDMEIRELKIDVEDPLGHFEAFAKLLSGECASFCSKYAKWYNDVAKKLKFIPVICNMLAAGLKVDFMEQITSSHDAAVVFAQVNYKILMYESRRIPVLTPDGTRILLSDIGIHMCDFLNTLAQTQSPVIIPEDRFHNAMSFERVCDYLNFTDIPLVFDTIEELQTQAELLGIPRLEAEITKWHQTSEHQQDVMEQADSKVNDIHQLLLSITPENMKKTADSILKGEWVSDRWEVMELVTNIRIIANARFTLGKCLADLCKELAERETECESMSDFRKYVADMPISGQTNGFFLYHVYNHGLISLERMEPVKAWFLPELGEPLTAKILQSFEESPLDRTIGGPFSSLPHGGFGMRKWDNSSYQKQQSEYCSHLMADNWKIYRECRTEGCLTDDRAKCIRSDDVAELQKYMEGKALSDLRAMDIREFFPFDGVTAKYMSLLSYAARFGALQCVKFLLMNGWEVGESDLTHAIEGGNSEIVQMVSGAVKVDQQNWNPLFNGVRPGMLHLFETRACKAIEAFHNDIFEWILDTMGSSLPQNVTIPMDMLMDTAIKVCNLGALAICIARGGHQIVVARRYEWLKRCILSRSYTVTETFGNLIRESCETIIDDCHESMSAMAYLSGNQKVIDIVTSLCGPLSSKEDYSLALTNAAQSGSLELCDQLLDCYDFSEFEISNYIGVAFKNTQWEIARMLLGRVRTIDSFAALCAPWVGKYLQPGDKYGAAIMSKAISLVKETHLIDYQRLFAETLEDELLFGAVLQHYRRIYLNKKMVSNVSNVLDLLIDAADLYEHQIDLIVKCIMDKGVEQVSSKDGKITINEIPMKRFAKKLLARGYCSGGLFVAVTMYLSLNDMKQMVASNDTYQFVNYLVLGDRCMTALSTAIINDDIPKVEYLLSLANIDPTVGYPDTSLVFACQSDRKIFNLVLDHYERKGLLASNQKEIQCAFSRAMSDHSTMIPILLEKVSNLSSLSLYHDITSSKQCDYDVLFRVQDLDPLKPQYSEILSHMNLDMVNQNGDILMWVLTKKLSSQVAKVIVSNKTYNLNNVLMSRNIPTMMSLGFSDVVQSILTDPRFDPKFHDMKTYAYEAMYHSMPEIVMLIHKITKLDPLMEIDGNVSSDGYGYVVTPLICAIMCSDEEVVREYVSDRTIPRHHIREAIIASCISDLPELVTMFVSMMGSTVDTFRNSTYLLDLACAHNAIKVMEMIMRNVKPSKEELFMALDKALSNCSIDIIRYLLTNLDVSVNDILPDGTTIVTSKSLNSVIVTRVDEILSLLLSLGLDVNMRDMSGVSPLQCAVGWTPSAVSLLLESGKLDPVEVKKDVDVMIRQKGFKETVNVILTSALVREIFTMSEVQSMKDDTTIDSKYRSSICESFDIRLCKTKERKGAEKVFGAMCHTFQRSSNSGKAGKLKAPSVHGQTKQQKAARMLKPQDKQPAAASQAERNPFWRLE